MILHPMPTKPVTHSPTDSTETYLRKCKQNIEAEVWALVSNSRQAVSVTTTTTATGNGCIILSVFKSGMRIACDQLQYNLMVLRGSLCLLTRARADGSVLFEKGRSIPSSSSSGAFLIGYVKPYIQEHAAIVGFLQGAIPSILKDIALLGTSRTPFAYDKRPFSDAVASNALQRQGVLGLTYTVEGIQGPPGTGKSSTIFHIVNSAMPAGMVAIVTCVQNRAVDALACKFRSSDDIVFLVLGSPDRLGDTAKQYALESRVEMVSSVVVQRRCFERVVRVLMLLHSARHKRETSRQFKSVGWRRWWVLYSRWPLLMADLERWSVRRGEEEVALDEARQSASQSLASDATVLLCTVDALSRVSRLHNNNNKKKTTTTTTTGTKKQKRILLIIDEAGTVPEFKLPLAISLGVEAVIAVGDQNQLQPFTHTGVPNGFFHRLTKTVSPCMLEEQFRMHPDMSGFVSSSFYSSKLFTNPAIASLRCAVPHAGVHWVDYSDPHAESCRSGAMCNQLELEILREFMVNHVSGIISEGKTVMLVTFYREQFHLLMLLGEKLGWVGTRITEGTKTERYFTHPCFRISTVDASQGSESDVVVLSCVRCNPRHDIGFLSHPNRVCVALSRARERLVLVGSSRTLSAKSNVWRALHALAQKKSGYFSDSLSVCFKNHPTTTTAPLLIQGVPSAGL